VFKAACRNCALRERCITNSAGTFLAIRPHDMLQREARMSVRNPQWHNEYPRYRPMVERAIAWLVRGTARFATTAWPKKTTGCTTATATQNQDPHTTHMARAPIHKRRTHHFGHLTRRPPSLASRNTIVQQVRFGGDLYRHRVATVK